MTRENAYLSDKHVQTLKDKLLADKERIINNENFKNPEQGHLSKDELFDPLDEASINIQVANDLRFRNRENFYLKKIHKSLKKIEDGTLGICEDCGVEIAFERLMARPTAELCIGCKEEAEMNEKHSVYQRRSKSLGKTLQEIGSR
jgi:DnaK suppressor protein